MPAITKDRAIEILRDALSVITEVAERCDGWSSFPSSPIEKANNAIDATEHITDAAATQAVPCVICGEEEPRTGTCGSPDPRALCNLATTAPAAVPTVDQELLALLVESQDSIGGDWRARRDAAVRKAHVAPTESEAPIVLPEKPEPKYSADDLTDIYTGDQMDEHATEAVRADRAAQKGQTK